MQDSFDSSRLFGNWTGLWMREPETVEKYVDWGGIDGSRCFVINSGSESWSVSYHDVIQAKTGDRFRFAVTVKLEGESIKAFTAVSAFDKHKQPLVWNYGKAAAERTGAWTVVLNNFSITENIAFIRFRICGDGKGESYFDDVWFRKLLFSS